jgi:hypothetical protein
VETPEVVPNFVREDSRCRGVDVRLGHTEGERWSRAHGTDISDTDNTSIHVLPCEEMLKVNLLMKIAP